MKSTKAEVGALHPRPYMPLPWDAFYGLSRLIWLGFVAIFESRPRLKMSEELNHVPPRDSGVQEPASRIPVAHSEWSRDQESDSRGGSRSVEDIAIPHGPYSILGCDN